MAVLAFTLVSVALAYLVQRILSSGHSRPTKLRHNKTTTKQDIDVPLVETTGPDKNYEAKVDTSNDNNNTTNAPNCEKSPPIVVCQLHTPPDSRTPTPPSVPISPDPQMDRDLMPPPPRPLSISQRSPQTQTPRSQQTLPQSTLRVPTTSPLPNRTPSSNRPFSLQPPTSSLTPNPLAARQQQQTLSASAAHTRSRKVVLQPGHSPLDWAALSKDPKAKLNGLPLTPGGPMFLRVTPSMLDSMNGRRQRPMWTSFKGRVYNIGPYLPFHPGGAGELKRCAGRAAERLFDEVHPWVNFEGLLAPCVVGVMVEESDEAAQQGLEGLD